MKAGDLVRYRGDPSQLGVVLKAGHPEGDDRVRVQLSEKVYWFWKSECEVISAANKRQQTK